MLASVILLRPLFYMAH